ncbi:MAG: hypothetical protein K6E29_00650 [Cyanobacteria bacterium RUI128]|nr:hypothetical protein [Cyanobacteria bacterium RUI128]
MLSNPGIIRPEVEMLNRYHQLPKNRAEAFENWTQRVEDESPFTRNNIDIVDRSKIRTEEGYKEEMKKFSEDYIAMADTDKDGKLSYSEFEAFNLQSQKFEAKNLLEYVKEVNAYKESLRTAYDRINVNNENDSEGKLDVSEIENYFAMMDSMNINGRANGNITKYEFERMSELVQDMGNKGKLIEIALKDCYEKNFKEQPVEDEKTAETEKPAEEPKRPQLVSTPLLFSLLFPTGVYLK